MWRRWGPQKFTMAYRIFLQLDINCSIFHVIFLWRCLDLDSNFAYHWTSFGFSCGTTKLPNQGIYLGLFICFGKCLQIGEVGLSKPSTANASISKCEWNVVTMSNGPFLGAVEQALEISSSCSSRGLFGGGAIGPRPQHFEVYLIGSNFLFRKLKFYISSNLGNFFSPPNSRLL